MADANNNRVQVFTAEGEYVRQFQTKGSHSEELKRPFSISVDSDNLVYVTEHINNRVSVFTCEGKFLTSFGSQDSFLDLVE